MKQQISLPAGACKRETTFLQVCRYALAPKCTLLFLFSIIFFNTRSDAQGTWKSVTAQSPHYNHGVMLLLPDGTVMAKTSSGGKDSYGAIWDILTPDIHGSYVNGTWTSTTPMYDSRLYFSSQVLKNGAVYIAGGEYGSGRTRGEIYYPASDAWVPAAPLPLATDTLSDANSEILDDGKVLQAIVISGNTVSNHTYIFDPVANTYTAGPPTLGIDNESAWVKFPDNSILFVNIFSLASERYIPATGKWVTDAPLPVQLYDPYGYETGAAFLLPDGRAFFIGSSGKTAYYTPSGNATPGAWVAGPVIPDTLGAPDAAAAMMVNGKILCAFSPVPVLNNVFLKPMVFYEFDYLTNSFIKTGTPNGQDDLHAPAYFSNMLCLPDGSVLYASQGDDQYYVYTPTGAPLAKGKPVIDSIVGVTCNTFLATGKRFNGITEGAGYGDDWQMATNYPLIRLSRNDSVYYARSYNWNSTGVMRGEARDTTWFDLPYGIPAGVYTLQVVVNGNASDSAAFAGCTYLAVKNTPEISGSNISVYPNPASQFTTVVFKAANRGGYTIKLVDVLGRVVRSQSGESTSGTNTCQLQLDGVKKGIYTIAICEGDGVYNSKLVIE